MTSFVIISRTHLEIFGDVSILWLEWLVFVMQNHKAALQMIGYAFYLWPNITMSFFLTPWDGLGGGKVVLRQ